MKMNFFQRWVRRNKQMTDREVTCFVYTMLRKEGLGMMLSASNEVEEAYARGYLRGVDDWLLKRNLP